MKSQNSKAKSLLRKISAAVFLCTPFLLSAQTLRLHYDLKQDAVGAVTVQDATGGRNNATLNSGAIVAMYDNQKVINLGANNGYADMGAATGAIITSLTDFTIHAKVYIPAGTSISGNGNFVWTFSNAENISANADGYMFLSAKDSRYSITLSNYSAESTLKSGSSSANMTKGKWLYLTVTQEGSLAKYYLDGELMNSAEMELLPQDLGSTAYNWLGRSCYKGDTYLKEAKIADFCIYDGALRQDSIIGLCDDLRIRNEALYRQQITDCMTALEIPEEARGNLNLPASAGEGVAISWKSSDESVITSAGNVTRPAADGAALSVTLTASFKKGAVVMQQSYTVRVAPYLSDAESVQLDLEAIELTIPDNMYQSVALPSNASEGSLITWTSSEPEFLSNKGKILKLSPTGEGKKEVTLTATAIKGEAKSTREFAVYIAEDEGYSSYLFAYFTGNSQSQEQIRLAISMDGYSYTPLNNGERIIYSDSIALKRAVRDPHILRGEDGKTFYMVVTDMKSSEGWSSNDGLVLLKSKDLINWTHKAIDFPDTWPARFNRQALTQVWAPQTIYDPQEGKYMVYYSIGENSQHYKIYYSYANEDFTELTQPQVLYDHGANTIDADIVYKDGLYHMFFKTEGQGNGIQKATASALRGTWTPNRKYLQQTSVAVEGSAVFKKINSDEWILMYDCYGSGYYEFCKSTDLDNFTKVAQTTTSGGFSPRHGTTIPITQEEAERLMAKWPTAGISPKPQGTRSPLVYTEHMVVNAPSRTLYLPVEPGTDLTAFDPQLYGFPGTKVTPAGAQNFTSGPVSYTFEIADTRLVYSVTAEVYGDSIPSSLYTEPLEEDIEQILKQIQYYDLNGILCGTDPELLPAGLYIREKRYENGKVESDKIVKW